MSIWGPYRPNPTAAILAHCTAGMLGHTEKAIKAKAVKMPYASTRRTLTPTNPALLPAVFARRTNTSLNVPAQVPG